MVAIVNSGAVDLSNRANQTEAMGDIEIDDEQLSEYREMIDELGSFPNKVLINTLSMVAEDHAASKESSKKVYDCIRERLLSAAGDHILPIIYVIDSILKNVKGSYISWMEDDAKNWMPQVYRGLPDETRKGKLKRVWNTWKDFNIFALQKWREMGECFSDSNRSTSPNSSSFGAVNAARIMRTKDGALLLAPALRKEMQKILDELQNDVDNELEKVSLERLADINPDLLANIKKAAEEASHGKSQSNADGGDVGPSGKDRKNASGYSFMEEGRSEESLSRSAAWAKLNLKHVEQTNDLVLALNNCVKEGSAPECRYTQMEAIDMTRVLAAASAAAELLSKSLERVQKQEATKNQTVPFGGARGLSGSAAGFMSIDKSKFTNDGIKEKNVTIIGMLYELGLPFVSTSDGRRFRTQLDLSNHLDRLFKRSQLEKSMARTEERGWYASDGVWTKEMQSDENDKTAGADNTDTAATSEEDSDPNSFTETADESRDRCVICGINFKMFFDNDDGMYKYSNCRDIEVMNDDAAERESDMMLVHVTCWRGLGCPATLDIDQTLQETRHF